MEARAEFFLRQFDLLTVEQRDLLEDWEVVLCDLSPLDADAFRLRMESGILFRP